MNTFRVVVIVLLVPFLYGCASSESAQVSYDRSSDTSTYTSPRSLMGYRAMSDGLASNQRVMWRAVASCSGEACTPDEVALVFYNDSNADLNLDYRRLQINFDGTSRHWEGLAPLDDQTAYRVPRGEFVRVPITSADFTRIAKATAVDVLFGLSGTSTFSVPFDRRASFRALATEMGLIP